MKRVIVCFGLLVSLALSASAQSTGKTGAKKQQVTAKKATPNKANTNKNEATTVKKNHERPTTLSSTGTYFALGNTTREQGRLTIADPVIRTLNERATTTNNIDVPGSGILGMPKLAYGIGNGQLIFRSTVAPAIGTSTGSGSVGTGTNVGAIGTAGNTLGVNGKNPYAGPGIYGLPLTDETGTRVTVEGSRPKGVRIKD
jgi:hypothetical protein